MRGMLGMYPLHTLGTPCLLTVHAHLRAPLAHGALSFACSLARGGLLASFLLSFGRLRGLFWPLFLLLWEAGRPVLASFLFPGRLGGLFWPLFSSHRRLGGPFWPLFSSSGRLGGRFWPLFLFSGRLGGLFWPLFLSSGRLGGLFGLFSLSSGRLGGPFWSLFSPLLGGWRVRFGLFSPLLGGWEAGFDLFSPLLGGWEAYFARREAPTGCPQGPGQGPGPPRDGAGCAQKVSLKGRIRHASLGGPGPLAQDLEGTL